MGIVYHANYLVWFDQARTEYLRSLNQTYRELEEMGVMLPVVKAECRYLAPAYYDDLVDIVVGLTALGAASLCFSYQVVRSADGRLLAEGQTKQAFVGRDMRPVNAQRQFPELWGLLRDQSEQS